MKKILVLAFIVLTSCSSSSNSFNRSINLYFEDYSGFNNEMQYQKNSFDGSNIDNIFYFDLSSINKDNLPSKYLAEAEIKCGKSQNCNGKSDYSHHHSLKITSIMYSIDLDNYYFADNSSDGYHELFVTYGSYNSLSNLDKGIYWYDDNMSNYELRTNHDNSLLLRVKIKYLGRFNVSNTLKEIESLYQVAARQTWGQE